MFIENVGNKLFINTNVVVCRNILCCTVKASPKEKLLCMTMYNNYDITTSGLLNASATDPM